MEEKTFFGDINKAYHQELNYKHVDGLLIKILWAHFAVLLLGVLAIYYFHPSDLYPSPFSWRNLALAEVGWVVAISFLASLIPTALRGRLPNHYHYRLLQLAAYMAYAFLLVFVSGGAIEMHFYLFGIWALLTLYCDWRLIASGFVLMVLYHIAAGSAHPTWLYFYGKNGFSLAAHSLFALLAALFTVNVAQSGRKAVADIRRANEFIQSKI